MLELLCRGQSERGGMDTTTQATGESIVGNEGVDADAMSTADSGFASFKEAGARVPILADEGSKGTKKSRTWTQQLALPPLPDGVCQLGRSLFL